MRAGDLSERVADVEVQAVPGDGLGEHLGLNLALAGQLAEDGHGVAIIPPQPSVPSELYGAGTQRAIWSGTARIQSLTATTGAGWPSSTRLT